MRLRALLVSFFVAAFMLCGTISSNAQAKKNLDYSGFFDSYYYHQKYSFVAGVNVPFYFGDICSSFGCTKINPGFTIGMGVKLWPRVYFGGDFSYFKLAADDENSNRPYSFTSNNYELLALGRYYFIEDIVRKHSDLKKWKKFKMYGTLGIGLNYVNPTATTVVNGTIINLNTIENQAYPKFIATLPVGIGFQYELSKRVFVIAEGMYRFTLSDYVDGISEAASPDADDSYLTFNLKLQYNPFAKRLKRKRKKVDPENIQIIMDDTTASSTKSAAPEENNSNLGEGETEYNEGEYSDYNEGEAEDAPEENTEDTPSENEEDYFTDEPEEEEEDSYEDSSDDGWDDGW